MYTQIIFTEQRFVAFEDAWGGYAVNAKISKNVSNYDAVDVLI